MRVGLTLLGAAALILGAFMKWYLGAVGTLVSMRMFIGSTGHARFIRSAGMVVIVIALVAILGLAPSGGWLTRLAGALGIPAFILFMIQVFRAPQGKITDVGPGAWLVLVGGVVTVIGGFFGHKSKLTYAGTTAVGPPA